MVADCVPVLFADTSRMVVAVAHAGWKGSVFGIANNVVMKMKGDYNCNLKDIKVWLGPSIQSCCYEVGDNVIDELKNRGLCRDELLIKKDGKPYLDLHQTNRQLLIQFGINADNIQSDPTCVSCQNHTYFSHRADNGRTGRFAAGIWLRELR
jgi:polyphenol oxidase